MSATLSSSQDTPYGVARVCRAWEFPRSTYYDWIKRQAIPRDERSASRKRGPIPAISDGELVSFIRDVLTDTEQQAGITGEGHRKVRARLVQRGIRVSKDRVLRVMRENALLAPTRTGRPRGPRTHDGTIGTDLPDVMWGTDATCIDTRVQGKVWVFAAIDHCTGECIGIHAAKRGTRFEALVPIQQGVSMHFGSLETGVAVGLSVRHDHGTQYMSRHFQDELRFLGIESSPSFVRQPEGNGVAERFMRTLKEQLLWITTFHDADELRDALLAFQTRYNANWLVARHKHRTPDQIRTTLLSPAA